MGHHGADMGLLIPLTSVGISISLFGGSSLLDLRVALFLALTCSDAKQTVLCVVGNMTGWLDAERFVC